MVGGVSLVSFAFFEPAFLFGNADPGHYLAYSAIYTALCMTSVYLINKRWPPFSLQVTFQIVTDIVFIVTLMAASGGASSGLGLLLIVSLASSGLIGRGRLVLFYAALASIAVLGMHTMRVWDQGASVGEYFHAGLLSMGFFAIAWLAHTLARYTLASERLAVQRGIDLKNLAQVNQLVIQDMQDGVMVVNAEDKVLQRNAQVEKLLGSAEVPQPGELRLVDYSRQLEERLQRWRVDPDTLFEPLRVAATNKQVRVRFVPVDADRSYGALIFLEDLSKVQAQAQQIKLAALGRLTANIAHEIRNPLSAIGHATQLLQEGPGMDKTEARLLQIIYDNSYRIERLVQDVLQLNRRDRAQVEEINLGSFLKTFVEEFCHGEKIPVASLAIELDTDQAICFDRFHLSQVLWNLCRNAWRHCQQLDGSIRLCVTQALYENIVQLDVIDDGPGVEPAVQGQLFEPFFTTDSKGTGLGLYIAREVCEASGATLEYVELAPGGQFRICCRGAPC